MQKLNDMYKYAQPGMMNPGMMNPVMNAGEFNFNNLFFSIMMMNLLGWVEEDESRNIAVGMRASRSMTGVQ